MQPSPRYWLPAHIRISPNTQGAVVLDLQRNRYFGIGLKETQAIIRVVTHRPFQSDPLPHQSLEESLTLARKLTEAGLLSTEPQAPIPDIGQIDLDGELASIGHEIDVLRTVHPGHVWHFSRACFWARRALRRQSLYCIAQTIGHRKKTGSGAFQLEECAALVGIFHRLRPLAFTAQDQCLFHALALIRFLSCYQLFPSWVIGVRMHPWAAHSWVQHHTLLVGARPEEVCEYAPILTV